MTRNATCNKFMWNITINSVKESFNSKMKYFTSFAYALLYLIWHHPIDIRIIDWVAGLYAIYGPDDVILNNKNGVCKLGII
jgi:hypothetical protein